MTRIKICGITRTEDALMASLAGADALGFNFSRKSPRVVSIETARDIITKIPPFVTPVGIFVEQTPKEVDEICRICRLHVAQLHSNRYTPEEARSIQSARVIRVFRPDEEFSIKTVHRYASQSGITDFLFDAYRPEMDGGTGERIKESIAVNIFNGLDMAWHAILAGGLNDENVGAAIRLVRPWAVDTASGVESAPGIKDPEKVRAFIEAVRNPPADFQRPASDQESAQ